MTARFDLLFSITCLSFKQADIFPEGDCDPSVSDYIPTIRSGSFADIGPKRHMEDEHIRIDDLASQVGSLFELPKPSAFYAVIYCCFLIIRCSFKYTF